MRNKIDEFREATGKFYSGELTVKDYKGISGGFGSYAQKGGGASMVRLRLAGGSVSRDKLGFIAGCIEKHGIEKVHLTTCQAIQLHGVSGDAAADIIERAFDKGIVTLGGGGDYPRNVMASPLSGVEKGECFDVLPHARKAEQYLLPLLFSVKLPRKLKVGFSNSPANETHATFRDLGFAAKPNGRFDVYSAGGLGNNPKMGLRVAMDVDPDMMLYYVKAMIDTFTRFGNYDDRSKARTRYMQETMGEDGYIKAYRERLADCLEAGGLGFRAKAERINKEGDGILSDIRAAPQKQEGLYSVSYHPIGGDPLPEKIINLYETMKDMPGAEVRVSPDQTLYVINLTASEAEKIIDITEDGAATLFQASVSCVGSTICQIGLRDSRGLLDALIEMEKKNGFADGVLPRIHISGCRSSCGAHQIGVIGLQGGSKQTAGGTVPGFSMSLDGSHLQGEERFGGSIGVIAETALPSFFEEIGKTAAASGTDFKSWYAGNKEEFLKIAGKYTG